MWFGDVLAGRTVAGEVLVNGARPGAQQPGAVSELIFTSGTEAAPKAIMHTEQTANFSVRVAAEDLGIGEGDVVWMPSPIGHSTGFNYGVRFALYHGLPLVLQDRWDAGVACDLIAARGASYTLASTTFLQDVVAEAERRGDRRLGSMTRFGCGGSPVPPELVRRAAACGIGVLRLYGSTEVLVATWNRPGTPAGKAVNTDGPALRDVEVEVRDENGEVAAPGAAGEIHIRGPNTCVGFYRDPARTAATFGPGGWLRSGDLATMDEDGYLTVVGRKKEIIIRGGLNITPREIEDLLLDFPEVDRAAVVGLPHERLGEQRVRLRRVGTPHRTRLRDDGGAPARHRPGDLQVARAARGPRLPPRHRIGQGAEVRNRRPSDGLSARARHHRSNREESDEHH